MPNVLLVGDSVSAGHTSGVRASLVGRANVRHGPDNAGGGNADGVQYGQLCTKYFLRTPRHLLPAWDVITFNFGLHDGAEDNITYRKGLSEIADTILAAAKVPLPQRKQPATVLYFLTTMPGGSHSVPGALSPSEKRVLELNEIATTIMVERNVTVVDLHKTMQECGKLCEGCKPHCPPEGYKYLSDHAIVPAISKALPDLIAAVVV